MAASAVEIAEKLGGAQTLGRPIKTLTDLRHAVEAGLPMQSLDAVAGYLAANEAEAEIVKRRIVPRPGTPRRAAPG